MNINATRPNQYRRTAPRVTPNRVAMRSPNRQNARGLPSRQPRHTCSVLHVGGGGALPVDGMHAVETFYPHTVDLATVAIGESRALCTGSKLQESAGLQLVTQSST